MLIRLPIFIQSFNHNANFCDLVRLSSKTNVLGTYACTADVREWYLQNGLQINPNKSEALIVGSANHLCVADSSSSSVSVAVVDLLVSQQPMLLGVVLNRRLTFHKQSQWLLSRAAIMRRPSVTLDIFYRQS